VVRNIFSLAQRTDSHSKNLPQCRTRINRQQADKQALAELETINKGMQKQVNTPFTLETAVISFSNAGIYAQFSEMCS
jgi:hypothetical protein